MFIYIGIIPSRVDKASRLRKKKAKIAENMYYQNLVQPCNEDGHIVDLANNEINSHKTFLVKSQVTDSNENDHTKKYVSFKNKHPTCNCFDWIWTGQQCKHILACGIFKNQGKY